MSNKGLAPCLLIINKLSGKHEILLVYVLGQGLLIVPEIAMFPSFQVSGKISKLFSFLEIHD